MNRKQIGGFEFKVFGYTVEVVTVNRIPRCLAVWNGSKFVWRVEG
jgi:hypothetical protein